MRYRFLLFLLFSVVSINVLSQNISGATDNSAKIEKKDVDIAKIRAFYKMTFRPDSVALSNYEEAQTVLLIGKSYSMFTDYYKYKVDSLNDACIDNGQNMMSVVPMMMAYGKKNNFDCVILTDFLKKNEIVQQKIGLDEYQYSDKPVVAWKIADNDSVIEGHPCRKAVCNLRGRNYTAFYATDIPLPYGPYKFGGLPGLIMNVYDDRGDYKFELNGLEICDRLNLPIYYYNSNDIRKTTREKTMKADKNNKDNPLASLMASGLQIELSEEDKASVQPKPYNPIELE